MRTHSLTWLASLTLLTLLLSGCVVSSYVGELLNPEGLEDVAALSRELDNQHVAVMIRTTPDILYTHPSSPEAVGTSIAALLDTNVEGITVIRPQDVLAYQTENPGWDAMFHRDLLEGLNVDRIVLVDLYEYRLHEPGNPHLILGYAAADVFVLSSDATDVEEYVFQNHSAGQWPPNTEIGSPTVDRDLAQRNLLGTFALEVAGMFYDHQKQR